VGSNRYATNVPPLEFIAGKQSVEFRFLKAASGYRVLGARPVGFLNTRHSARFHVGESELHRTVIGDLPQPAINGGSR